MRIFEKISFYSDLELIPFSQKLEQLMSLPPFEFDAENDNRWSWTYDLDFIQINLSWPYLSYKLQEWDQTAPAGCNYTLILMSDYPNVDYEQEKYKEEYVISILLPKYMTLLRKIAGEVHYHAGNHHEKYLTGRINESTDSNCS